MGLGLGGIAGFGGKGKTMGFSSKDKFVDPLGLKKSKPSTAKTAEEIALERRQRSMLDEEIEESEERFKAMARGQKGRGSLLSQAKTKAASSPAPSMLGSTSPGSGPSRGAPKAGA